jgi:hypothetical protein
MVLFSRSYFSMILSKAMKHSFNSCTTSSGDSLSAIDVNPLKSVNKTDTFQSDRL